MEIKIECHIITPEEFKIPDIKQVIVNIVPLIKKPLNIRSL